MRSGCEAVQTVGCGGGGETRRLHGGTMEPPPDRRLLLQFATVPCSLPPSQLQVMLADGRSLPSDQQAAVAAGSGGKACPLSLLQPEKALLLARWQCLLEDKAQLTALLQLARGARWCKQLMRHDQQQRCGSVPRGSRKVLWEQDTLRQEESSSALNKSPQRWHLQTGIHSGHRAQA